MSESQTTIAESLRSRLLRGLEASTLAPGDRLPSSRELVAEFGVDSRLILAAYRQLSEDGLVEIRERGGVYVSADLASGSAAASWPAKWFSELFSEALSRGISGPALAENLRRSLETLRLHAVVISSTEDQVVGLARELRDDFGLIAEGFPASVFAAPGAKRDALRRADLLVATEGQADLVQRLSAEYSTPSIVLTVRSDFMAGEWAMLLRQPIWVVVATPEFGKLLRSFLGGLRGIENLHVMVIGKDDLTQIPAGAATYVTHRVRDLVDLSSISGRILPAARTISTESARELFGFVVSVNIQALQAVLKARDKESRGPER